MKKKFLKIFFPILFIGLCFQYWYALTEREPFPAIMMPGFRYQSIENSIHTFPDVRFQAIQNDNEVIELSKHELFSSMHLPQRHKVTKRIFDSDFNFEANQELIDWLENHLPTLERVSSAKEFKVIRTTSTVDFNYIPPVITTEVRDEKSIRLSP